MTHLICKIDVLVGDIRQKRNEGYAALEAGIGTNTCRRNFLGHIESLLKKRSHAGIKEISPFNNFIFAPPEQLGETGGTASLPDKCFSKCRLCNRQIDGVEKGKQYDEALTNELSTSLKTPKAKAERVRDPVTSLNCNFIVH
ncbi:hypothetical protein, unlikely [Trypanosoma brucei gambiense DAL972]|uniref:Uncharacterized protein n=1 Tax=Trypanosoma brucei gambiense (strain MHOM/CI/86/DAL972) TaxID=679716 RepID=C9ZQ59_TRYB9|nr:hypothetical protein, unlikely [Trypanosoma brucei gambiense DAL972]CBH11539.1 hypothetical protein, unlikely [Trypanosoma brucei gambiense DAL972]|eukprot:XP_011773824.1 hypothetical protein, unlikely [Trypanosoma brucei gambiense DAL972]